jgi:hypothetical protein
MEKLKNVVRVNVNNEMNKFDNFIFDNLDSVLGGDWSNYDDGEEVVYEIDLMEINDGVSFIDDWNESNIKGIVIGVDEIKEYVGEGICYIDESWDDDRCWYNVEFEGDVLKISYVYDDNESEWGDEDEE